eukprot:1688222-Rhodomonas_salina.2
MRTQVTPDPPSAFQLQGPRVCCRCPMPCAILRCHAATRNSNAINQDLSAHCSRNVVVCNWLETRHGQGQCVKTGESSHDGSWRSSREKVIRHVQGQMTFADGAESLREMEERHIFLGNGEERQRGGVAERCRGGNAGRVAGGLRRRAMVWTDHCFQSNACPSSLGEGGSGAGSGAARRHVGVRGCERGCVRWERRETI